MMELPEALSRAKELGEHLSGKTVERVCPPSSPHKFCWYYLDVEGYDGLLQGKTVLGAEAFGMYTQLRFSDSRYLCVNDGVNLRLWPKAEDAPKKYQLLVLFTDGTALSFTVAMYGGILCHQGEYDNEYYLKSKQSVSPLNPAFDRAYFEALATAAKPTLSAKALLATEQRIPGIGNGVLQDILLTAGIHPKRKNSSLTKEDRNRLFDSIKSVLREMADKGGRDTERDIFGIPGGYRTKLSRNTFPLGCPLCGGIITKEAYLGGAVYYCQHCQPKD